MIRIEQLATAALEGHALLLRSLVHDWLEENPSLKNIPEPNSIDQNVLIVAAGLIELFAERLNQQAPQWINRVGAASQPVYLVKAAQTMPRLRELCLIESPFPLRRRNLFAPPTYLQSA